MCRRLHNFSLSNTYKSLEIYPSMSEIAILPAFELSVTEAMASCDKDSMMNINDTKISKYFSIFTLKHFNFKTLKS